MLICILSGFCYINTLDARGNSEYVCRLSIFIYIYRMQREQAQLLRQQQDQAYLDSLKADQEKVREQFLTIAPFSSLFVSTGAAKTR